MNAPFKISQTVLETERLILRPFKKEDLEDFFQYASVEGVGEMAGWKHHQNKEDSKQILEMFIQEDKVFALFHKKDQKVIGSLGVELYRKEEELTEFSELLGREIGYVLSKDYWGKGLMKEALSCVIDYLFNILNFDFVLCGYFSFNHQSKRVQEKCGFIPYLKTKFDTRMNTQEEGILNLLTNPSKNIKLNLSRPETSILKK